MKKSIFLGILSLVMFFSSNFSDAWQEPESDYFNLMYVITFKGSFPESIEESFGSYDNGEFIVYYIRISIPELNKDNASTLSLLAQDGMVDSLLSNQPSEVTVDLKCKCVYVGYAFKEHDSEELVFYFQGRYVLKIETLSLLPK